MATSRVRWVAVLAVASVPIAFSACGEPAAPQCPSPPPPTTVTVATTGSVCPSMSTTTTTSVATTPTDVPPLDDEGEATTTPCADSLDACPDYGCATDDGKKAFNQLKRTKKDVKGKAITAQNATPITVATLIALQQKTQGPKKGDFTADARKQIASITVGNQKLGEGVAVRIVGYMLDDASPKKGVHANTGESVNCNLKGVDNNDFHIPLLANAGDNECTGAVAEMIPQGRLASWGSKPLRTTAHDGKRVMFVGRLFYDNAHDPNPQCQNNGDPKRATIWEVHPVVEYYVCDSGNCTEKSMNGWNKIEDQ
jgi:hypothetical protein